MPGTARRVRLAAAAALAALVTVTLAGPAARADEPVPPRALRDLRFEERWHWLADPALVEALGEDFWDPIKRIDLVADPADQVFLSLGGSVRLRGEAWSGYHFGGPSTASSNAIFGLTQFRLHTDWQLTRYLRVFAEARSALVTERDLPDGERPEDVDAIDLADLFFDLVLPLDADGHEHLTLRTGRQELRLGSGRLVSPDPWTNSRRSLDAVRLLGHLGPFSLDGFAAMVVERERVDFDESSLERTLSGALLGATVLDTEAAALALELYWLLALDDEARVGGVVGESSRHTLGGRILARLPTGFELEAEGAWQLGEHAGRAIEAGFLAFEVRRVFEVLEGLEVAFALDLATGDRDPFDDTVATFSAPYGERHRWLGMTDTVGRPNVMSPSLRVALEPLERLGVWLEGHAWYVTSGADLLYEAGERPIRAPAEGGGRFVGGELDLGARYVFDEHSAGELGYGHAFAGSAIEDSGGGHDVDFGYLQYQYAF